MRITFRGVIAMLAVAGTLTLSACGGTNQQAAAQPATAAPPANAPTTTAPAAQGSPVAGAPVKVSANGASRAELQRAFEAAGIPNAGRIAGEVEEYRPYPTDDPSFAKLRRELAKYNIPTEVVSRVIETLEL